MFWSEQELGCVPDSQGAVHLSSMPHVCVGRPAAVSQHAPFGGALGPQRAAWGTSAVSLYDAEDVRQEGQVPFDPVSAVPRMG